MRLKFRKIPIGAAPSIVGGFAGLLLQLFSPRLAAGLLLSMCLATCMNHVIGGLAFVFASVATWMFVPLGDGPELWILVVDAVAVVCVLVGRRMGDTRWLYAVLAIAVVLGRPTADSVLFRSLKINAAFFMGVLLWSDVDSALSPFHGQSSAPFHVALVLLLGPLYTLYGVFVCCNLAIDQLEIY